MTDISNEIVPPESAKGTLMILTLPVIISECVSDVHEFLLCGYKGINHFRIKKPARFIKNVSFCLLMGKSPFVNPAARNSVIDIGERHEAARQGNISPFQTARIAASVPSFVM